LVVVVVVFMKTTLEPLEALVVAVEHSMVVLALEPLVKVMLVVQPLDMVVQVAVAQRLLVVQEKTA
jgi:hypothetical protein